MFTTFTSPAKIFCTCEKPNFSLNKKMHSNVEEKLPVCPLSDAKPEQHDLCDYRHPLFPSSNTITWAFCWSECPKDFEFNYNIAPATKSTFWALLAASLGSTSALLHQHYTSAIMPTVDMKGSCRIFWISSMLWQINYHFHGRPLCGPLANHCISVY